MTHVGEMLRTHPERPAIDEALIRECIEACFDCAQTCIACADACLAEPMVQELLHCIRLNQDCADVCATTGRLLSRLTQPNWAVVRAEVEACMIACRACGAECRKHAGMHEHCRVCAEACRRCEEACSRLLQALPA